MKGRLIKPSCTIPCVFHRVFPSFSGTRYHLLRLEGETEIRAFTWMENVICIGYYNLKVWSRHCQFHDSDGLNDRKTRAPNQESNELVRSANRQSYSNRNDMADQTSCLAPKVLICRHDLLADYSNLTHEHYMRGVLSQRAQCL